MKRIKVLGSVLKRTRADKIIIGFIVFIFAIGWILGILLFVNGIELVILSLSKEKKEIGACILGVQSEVF